MEFNAYGPCSLRRNDLTTLEMSGLEEQLEELYEPERERGERTFVIYGDSAYAYGEKMSSNLL